LIFRTERPGKCNPPQFTKTKAGILPAFFQLPKKYPTDKEGLVWERPPGMNEKLN